jgi:molybdopterin molybdotransferase
MVAVAEAFGRTLAQDLAAMRTQPPSDVSAMDGYAVRAADIASLPARLKRIGESAAGHGFAGNVGAGETVRIFTGAPVPQGADSILIQENARVDGDIVEALQSVAQGYSVRGAGIDFTEAATLLAAGTRLSPADIALAAAMNHARLPVYRKPRVAILATGD